MKNVLQALNAATQQHAISNQILIQSAICRALPRNAHVVMDNLPQSIMASLVEATGMSCDFVVFEPLIRKYGFKLADMFAQAGLPLLCLGAECSTLRITPRVEAGFSLLARAPLTLAVQTVDDALLGLQRINWLAFERVDVTFLNQSINCVTQHRPLISLTFEGSVTSLLQWCEVHHYTAVDATLRALSTTSTASQKVYLFPDQVLLDEVETYLTPEQIGADEVLLANNQLAQKWPALCNAGDNLGNLTQKYLKTCTRQYPLATMMATNLYASEWHDDTEWRWTGPGHDTTILLPMRARGLYRVSLSVLALPEGKECGFVRCFMNGVPVFGQDISAGDKIAFDYVSNKPEEPVELLLSVTDLQNCGGRPLGVAISGIEVVWNLSE